MKRNLKRWLPLAAWVMLIFSLSSIPSISSEGVKLPSGFDKVIHFVEYAIFAVLFYRGLSYDGMRIRYLVLIIVVLTGTGVGALDEMYQSYIPGRDSSVLDLAADSAGIVFGLIAAAYRHVRILKKVDR